MSLNKYSEKSFYQKKADEHLESWQEEVDHSIGRSAKELGIFNRKDLEAKIATLRQELIKRKELEFINELKNENPDVGVFLVGGTVRDAVFEKESKDIDLIINKVEPSRLLEVLLKFGKVTFDRNPKLDVAALSNEEKQKLIKESYGVIKFMPHGSELKELIDIAFPRTDDYSLSGKSGIQGIKRDTETIADPDLSMFEDLSRRDFTFNAMAVNLVNGDIYDPHDGMDDLIKGAVKCVGDPEDRILKEDMSRGLRAIRFACVMKAQIENQTKKTIREIFKPAKTSVQEVYGGQDGVLEEAEKYDKETRQIFKIGDNQNMPKILQTFWDKEQKKPRMAVAREVISKEVLKSIMADPKRFVEILNELRGLSVILPELAALKLTKQSKKHHREGNAFVHTMKVLENLPVNASLSLKLAALFHDIGKAETGKLKEDGNISFTGHDKRSAELFSDIAKRLRLDNKTKAEVEFLISRHMLPLNESVESIRALKLETIFLKDEELGNALVSLAEADAKASIQENGEIDLSGIEILKKRIGEVKVALAKIKEDKAEHYLSGDDLIRLGFKPGPRFGDILDEAWEMQLQGKIKNKDEAEEFVGGLEP